MHKRPFLWAAAFLSAGLLLPAPELPWPCWALCGLTSFAGSIALCWSAPTGSSARAAGIFLAAGFVCAGRTACLISGIVEPFDITALVGRHADALERGVDLAGTVAAPPAPGPSGTDLLLDTHGVWIGGIRHIVRGRVRFRIPSDSDGAAPSLGVVRGDRVELFARLFIPRSFGNPGAFDYQRHLKTRGIDAIGSVKSERLIHCSPPDPTSLATEGMRRVDRIRATILSRIDRAFRDTGAAQTAPISAALLLGERRFIPSSDETRLAEAGLSHLLAVSGFNVAVLAGLLHLLARAVGLSRRIAAALVIPALFLYLLLNRDESSVVRAVVMAVTLLGGVLIWRRYNPLNALGLSAVIILSTGPSQMLDAGFQLTFVATLSLILVAPRLFSSERDRRRTILSRASRWLKIGLVVSLAAALGTVPLTILHFNRVTPGAIPANIVAGPMMAAAFVTSGLIVATEPISEPLTRTLARVTTLLVESTFHVADLVRAFPLLTYRRATPGPIPILVYYLALIRLLMIGPGRWCEASRTLIHRLVLYSGMLWLLIPFDTRVAPAGLRLTALDVGQGDAILVETSGGSRLLVDAGGSARGDFDIGERVVAPALWALGLNRIDVLAVTHPDADHAGGAASITAGFRPREIWLPAGASRWPPRRATMRLFEAAGDRKVVPVELSAGEVRCLRGACVKVLNPPRQQGSDNASNERSLVLAISSRGARALLAADAGALTETRIAGLLRSFDYLKVGHHGSRTGTTSGFLRIVRPRVAVISCGRRNRFGHPDRGVVSRLLHAEARVCRTDRSGATTVELITVPRRATLIDSACLLGGDTRVSHSLGQERARDETEDQNDKGDRRQDDPAPGESP